MMKWSTPWPIDYYVCGIGGLYLLFNALFYFISFPPEIFWCFIVNFRPKKVTEQSEKSHNVDEIIEAVKQDSSNVVDHLFHYYYKETRPSEPLGMYCPSLLARSNPCMIIQICSLFPFRFKDVWYSKTQKMLKFTFNALIQQQAVQ